MIWYALILIILVWGLLKLLPKIRESLRPRPEDLISKCPHCGTSFEGTRRYCMGCGGQIWDEVLSEDKK